jgi:hypothetical protein
MNLDAPHETPQIDVTPANVLRAGGLAFASAAGSVLGLLAVLLTVATVPTAAEPDPAPPGPAVLPPSDGAPLPVEHGRQVPIAPPSPVPTVPPAPDAPAPPPPPRPKTPADDAAVSLAARKRARKRERRIVWAIEQALGRSTGWPS